MFAPDYLNRDYDPVTGAIESSALFIERDRFVREFGFAVPTREALDKICCGCRKRSRGRGRWR
jgi:hypothetical protein